MDLKIKKCVPCSVGAPVLSIEEEDTLLQQLNEWILIRENTHKLKKEFIFIDFKRAITFVNRLAELSEAEGHHPDITITYNHVTIILYTYKIKGLHQNDFILAAKIDAL